MLKKLLKYVIVFITLILLFNLLLFVTSLFPSSLIKENVEESAETLVEEGNFKELKFSIEYIDNCTTALMINMAYSVDNENPVYSYMSARRNYDKNITKTEIQDMQGNLVTYNSDSEVDSEYNPAMELKTFLARDITISPTYARYWHGWLAFYRVLLLFFNLVQIRIVLFLILLILFIWLLKLVKEKMGIVESIICALSLLFVDYFYVAEALADAPIFIVMMIASIILLKKIEKIKNLSLYFFIVGCVSNFVDFLRVPLISLGVPLVLYIAYNQKNNKECGCKDYIKIIIKSCIAWGTGYALTWVAKWIIYDIIYQNGFIKSAIEQVIYRINKGASAENPYTLLEVMLIFMVKNVVYMFIAIAVILVIGCIRGKFLKLRKISDFIKEIIPYLIIALMPILWYITLKEHTVSSGHMMFIYRHMLIFDFAILMGLRKMLKTDE